MAIVKFANPPLLEVVLAVELEETNFSSVDFGLYWQAIRERFPSQVDRAPIIDNDIDLSVPPLRRALFISSDSQKMVQIQDNFFGYNWRNNNQSEYPHFEKIFAAFLEEWIFLQEWWSKLGKDPFKPSRYELTYLNVINKENSVWNNTADHQKIFTFLGGNWDGILGIPEFQDIQLVFSLPDSEGELTVTVDQRTAEADDSDFVLFRLTAQSLDANKELPDWFKLAHEHIVRGFLELTKKDAQQKWGRYEN
ncbi:TIGR04255 family protein [Argonema antarcticum]|uniref:TIGR04255 family protein n=1 Tax=Argonema antarcticum TaxID=2942763 RepID=UPI002012FFB1|nr:TIGR04255 family protein [Argonema antarcticum]MCL1470773.1 TIGR04255 family protein [Argonema antarcticum A004/B2]